MKYRKVGNSDLNVSIVGCGTWGISGDFEKVEEKSMLEVLKKAYDLGINFFDTAPAYGFGVAEKFLGKALKKYREKIIIATKCGAIRDEAGKMELDLSRENIKKEISESLKRLETDYIDLYQVHWPDPKIEIEETFTTLNDLKSSGKVRYIGVCNFSVQSIDEAMKYCEIVSSQNLYNIIQRNSNKFYSVNLAYQTEKEILPYCREKNLGFFPYAPFCQGLLTGNKLNRKDFLLKEGDRRLNNPELNGEKLKNNLEFVDELQKISEKINKPLTQIIINWLIKNETVTSVIAGPMKISDVIDNVASTNWDLHDDVYIKINELIRHL